jgi:site-specific DNA-adenine methylase
VSVVVTNNDTKFVRGLFGDGYEIEEISVKRSINRDASGRKGRELIIVGK